MVFMNAVSGYDGGGRWLAQLYTFLHSAPELTADVLHRLPIFCVATSDSSDASSTTDPLTSDTSVSAAGCDIARLADGPVFTSLPEDWKFVLQTGVARELAHDFSDSRTALEFLGCAGIITAHAPAIIDLIQEQHTSPDPFSSMDAIWYAIVWSLVPYLASPYFSSYVVVSVPRCVHSLNTVTHCDWCLNSHICLKWEQGGAAVCAGPSAPVPARASAR